MANNTKNGRTSMYSNSNNPSQAADDEQDKKVVTIVLPVFVVGILLLKLLCFCIDRDKEDEEHAGGERESSVADGGRVYRAPSSTVAGAAVEVAPVPAPESPLVCTYREAEADGWRDSSCGVCLAELADGDVLRVLPACLHYFHADCVGEWLRAHATCPLCRAPLVAPAAAA